jgi:hypothetical protein
MLDLHRIAEERSIAYHRVIAQRLPHDGSLLEIARARVQGWLEGGHPIPEYARAWSEILDQDVETIAGSLIDSSERGRELRQSSPFAGCLSAQERWRLWREVRDLIEQTDDT